MKRHCNENENKEVRVELKYCERCGGLWVRESGAETVYCESCQRSMGELPVPRKGPKRITLPVQRKSVVEGFEDDGTEFEAAGGAA